MEYIEGITIFEECDIDAIQTYYELTDDEMQNISEVKLNNLWDSMITDTEGEHIVEI